MYIMFKVIYNRYGMIMGHFRIFEKSTDKIVKKILKFINMTYMRTLYFELRLIQSRDGAKHSPFTVSRDDIK